MNLIETCAYLCDQSYSDVNPNFVTVDDLKYGVFETDHGKIIVIRGTDNLENWGVNANVLPARSCGGFLAHKGFVKAYRELCSGGMPTNKDPNVIATGHSLGGALATLLAEHIGCKLITFGSPRVYWRFSRAPKLDHIRVVRDDDPVPKVPNLLYSHRQEPLVLKDGDHRGLQVKDHFMTGYIEAYAKALKELK